MTAEERAQAHDVLVRARNLIARDGWQRYHYSDSADARRGPFCSTGAIQAAAEFGPTWKPAQLVVERIVGVYVTLWNDRDGRTEADVLAAFDKAIAATAPTPDLSFLRTVKVEPEVRA